MAIARERESGERVVVGLPIVMPTTKQWDKVKAGLGFGNFAIQDVIKTVSVV